MSEAGIVDLPHYGDGEIDSVIRNRVCARCYGHLTLDADHDAPREYRWVARCLRCGNAWHGATVSRRYAENLAAQGRAEYDEILHNPDLQDILPPRPKQSEAELLRELGY